MDLDNCAAYIPSSLVPTSPTLLSDIQPSDLALDQLPTSPLGHMIPAPPHRLLPIPPRLSTHEISSSNPYESIPYTKHVETSADTHAYSRLARSQLTSEQAEGRGCATMEKLEEREYDKVALDEVPERSGEVTETNESYDDAI